MPLKSNKTISANSKGIVVSFTDVEIKETVPKKNINTNKVAKVK